MRQPTILIAEGEEASDKELRKRLLHQGFTVKEFPNIGTSPQIFQKNTPDLIIINSSQKTNSNGLNQVEQIRHVDRKIPIIFITNQSSEARVIAALKVGVNDYIKIPYTFEELLCSIDRNLPPYGLNVQGITTDKGMIGNSSKMKEIKDYLLRVADTDSTVFITGETGTGKELVAELIHKNSKRRKNPFICINCAALPESLLESEMFGYERGAFTGAYSAYSGKLKLAEGGTAFFDEIGEMNPYAQAKILRVIETKSFYPVGGKKMIPVNTRIIAATNQDPDCLMAEGKFRKDLYYRLNVARVHLPPLRDRKDDIPKLLEHTIHELNARFGQQVEGLTEKALTSLIQYDWPGNIRELKNLMEATFINLPHRRISLVDLPKIFQQHLLELEGSPKSERDQMLSALFSTNWNKSKAAEKLHWSRMTLYRKMAKYSIVNKPPD